MLAAPFAAANVERLQKIPQQLGKLRQAVEERIFYERLVPPVGMETISYARFMELMYNMKVKRVIVLSEGTAAIVEVWSLPGKLLRHSRTCEGQQPLESSGPMPVKYHPVCLYEDHS